MIMYCKLFWAHRCPQGTDDTTVPYHCATRVKTFIPHAELLTIEGGRHGILETHADEVAKALIKFLSQWIPHQQSQLALNEARKFRREMRLTLSLSHIIPIWSAHSAAWTINHHHAPFVCVTVFGTSSTLLYIGRNFVIYAHHTYVYILYLISLCDPGVRSIYLTSYSSLLYSDHIIDG